MFWKLAGYGGYFCTELTKLLALRGWYLQSSTAKNTCLSGVKLTALSQAV